MSRLTTSLLTALISAGITFAALHRVGNRRLREADTLRHENIRLRQTILSRQQQTARPVTVEPATAGGLEKPAAQLHERIQEHAQTRQTAVDPGAFHNAGNATPAATLQTIAWACDHSDTAALVNLIYFDGNSRGHLDALLATLPPSLRSQYRSTEEFAAFLLSADAIYRRFPGPDILDKAVPKEISPDRIVMQLPNTLKDGTQYQKTGDGWKYVVLESTVDAFANQIAEITAAPGR